MRSNSLRKTTERVCARERVRTAGVDSGARRSSRTTIESYDVEAVAVSTIEARPHPFGQALLRTPQLSGRGLPARVSRCPVHTENLIRV